MTTRAYGVEASKPAGYTLLELMVVLVVVGLLVAVTFPNLERLYASVVRSTEQDRILDQFATLGRQAVLSGRDYVVLGTADVASKATALADYEPYPLDLPDGWRVRLDKPLLVRANGVCLGGEVTLLHADSPPLTILLRAPYCRVDTDG